jgi:hypothetical protein
MASKTERRIREILAGLPEAQAAALLEYAEFLASRHSAPADNASEPLTIQRPEKESVIRAIRRLGATYPMVDRSKILNETSVLMTQHVIHGRNATEVIDELEILFRQYYEKQAEK